MQGMNEHYQVRLVARNEGIEYSDKNGVYRFNVALTNRERRVYLPGSKEKEYKNCDLTDAARAQKQRDRSLQQVRGIFWIQDAP